MAGTGPGAGARLDEETYDAYAVDAGHHDRHRAGRAVGYYRTLAQLLDVFDVGVPED